ncbi:hypothetical protein C5Y93_21810 [Blastopirellula marina]|uniref:Acylneuraminate cytidylyltransferase n=1 Tax=Blastopirellula marina TaxID=124 RepID=A0A2S8GH76_9BACT|nr:hypothetical protein C5Y93_21810 [Blastopirellula marina]
METDVLIVIPAKGNSSAIPRKNLAIAAGRPLLWYTLDYIKRIRAVAKSVVVTDDDEIEAFVLDAGEGIRVAREPVVQPASENTILATYRGIVAAAAQGDFFSKVVILQGKLPPPQSRRDAVKQLYENYSVSERRACRVLDQP